jgi:hypothetical protein
MVSCPLLKNKTFFRFTATIDGLRTTDRSINVGFWCFWKDAYPSGRLYYSRRSPSIGRGEDAVDRQTSRRYHY